MKRKKAAVMPASSNAVGAISRLLSTLRSPSKGGEEVHPSVHVHVVPPVEHATAEPGTGSVAARGSQIRLQLEDMEVSEAEPSPPLSFAPTPKPLPKLDSVPRSFALICLSQSREGRQALQDRYSWLQEVN